MKNLLILITTLFLFVSCDTVSKETHDKVLKELSGLKEVLTDVKSLGKICSDEFTQLELLSQSQKDSLKSVSYTHLTLPTKA